MIATRIGELFPSGIRAVMTRAQEMEEGGATVIHMEVGQPHFETPAHVKHAVQAALRGPVPGYTPNLGMGSLRRAVAERVFSRTGIAVGPENVAVTSGAVMGLTTAILATVEPGSEVLVPDPGWPNYQSAVVLAGARPVPYSLEPAEGFVPDLERIESLITPRTSMIMINSPSNPTGVVVGEELMRGLVELAERRGIYILSDEIYEDMVFRGEHHSILAGGLTDRLIMVSGVSKSYAMTGWRIGWAVAAEPVVSAIGKLIEPLSSCPTTISQIAAEAALRGPQDTVVEMREAFAKAVSVLTEILGPTGTVVVQPGGAFYVLLDMTAAGLSSDEVTHELLEKKHVAVAPGSTFGRASHGYVRVSTALSDSELVQGCRRIREYWEERAA